MTKTHGIFKIDSDGFAHWAHPHLMSGREANALADRSYPECHVLPYWRAKQLADPDKMSEPALRRHLGLPARNGLGSVAVSGTFEGMSRKEVVAYLEAKGLRVVADVSSTTRALYVGENPSQRKIDKARRLGVVVKGLAR